MLKLGRYWPWKTVSSHFHMPVRPMLLHRPSFLFDCFVKIWATCKLFLGKWFTAPPGKKLPVRLWYDSCTISANYKKKNFLPHFLISFCGGVVVERGMEEEDAHKLAWTWPCPGDHAADAFVLHHCVLYSSSNVWYMERSYGQFSITGSRPIC